MNSLFLNDHRCKCGKLLLRGIFFDGTLEIKCKKCGAINSIGKIKLENGATSYLFITDARGIIMNVSESACRILGYSYDELIGKHFAQIHGANFMENKNIIEPERIVNEDTHYRFDSLHQTKDGKQIPVSILLRPYQPSAKEKYILAFNELKQTASDGKALGAEALEFAENTCDFYFEIDKDKMIKYISPLAKNFFGFPPEVVLGKNYFNFLSVKAKAKAKRVFEYFSVNQHPFKLVHKFLVEENGKEVNAKLYFCPNFNDKGKFIGYHVSGWAAKNL